MVLVKKSQILNDGFLWLKNRVSMAKQQKSQMIPVKNNMSSRTLPSRFILQLTGLREKRLCVASQIHRPADFLSKLHLLHLDTDPGLCVSVKRLDVQNTDSVGDTLKD